MPQPVKYSTSSVPNAIKKGNMAIGVNQVEYGPTSITSWYAGISPPVSGYTVYVNKVTQGPSILVASNDNDLVSIAISQGAANTMTGVTNAFNFFKDLNDRIVIDKNYNDIVTSGLVLNLDTTYVPSYPRNGSFWNDVSNFLTSPNFQVVNLAPQLTSWSVKRSDITLVTNISPPFAGAQVWKSVVNTSAYVNTLHRTWSNGNSNGIIGDLGNGFYRYYMWVRGETNNSATATAQIDISDGGGLATTSSVIGKNNQWTLLSTFDLGGGYNADKFFDLEYSNVSNGDTFYISSIVITRYDVLAASGLTQLNSFPGYINYNGTTTVQKQARLLNGVTYNTNGFFDLDGTDDAMSISDDTNLDFSGSNATLTSELLINLDVYRSLELVNSKGDSGLASQNNYNFIITDSWVYFRVGNGTTTINSPFGISPSNLPVGRWGHIVAVLDSTHLRLYLNGTQIGTGTARTIDPVSNNENYFIASTQYPFDGKIAISRLYNRNLSQSEILQNYYGGPIVTSGLTFAVDASNLVSFQNGSGSTFSLVGSYTGTLQNGVSYTTGNSGCWVFDGIDDRISFGTGSNFDYTNFTAGIWAKSPTNMSGGTGFPIHVTNLVGKGNWNSNNSWRIGYKSSGTNPATFITFGYGITWSAGPSLSVNSFDLSVWNYFVGVATPTQQFLYLNGNLVSTVNLTKISVVNVEDFQIGRSSYVDRFFTGNVGHSHIYDRALSAAEVAQNFNAQKRRFGF